MNKPDMENSLKHESKNSDTISTQHAVAGKDKRIAVFEDYPIPKAVMTLVAPSIVGMLVMMLYNLADTWFVGLLNDPIQTAAVSLAATVILAFNAVNNLFGVGTSSLMGRALGEKDFKTVEKSSAFGVWGAIVFGLLFSLLVWCFSEPLLNLLGATDENRDATYDYLFYTAVLGAMPSILNVVMGYLVRTEGSALASSIGTMSGCILNVILDPFFILPQYLNMGAAGAGLATLISNCVACLYFFILIAKRGKRCFVCVNPAKSIPSKYVAREVFSVGLPAAIQNLLNVTGMTVLNNLASAFGSVAVSAIGISHKAVMLMIYVSMGFANGANPIVSYNYGAKNIARAKSCAKFTAIISVSLGAVMAVFYYIFSAQIITLFMKNEEIIAMGRVFIRAMCIAVPFISMDFVGVGIYQAVGKGKISLCFAIGRKLVLEIPIMLLLNRLYPLYGLAWEQTIAEFILSIAAVFVLITLFRRLEREQSAEAPRRK